MQKAVKHELHGSTHAALSSGCVLQCWEESGTGAALTLLLNCLGFT